MRSALAFAGFVLLGLAEAWWAKTAFSSSIVQAAILLFGAGSAWVAAPPPSRLTGLTMLATVHVIFLVVWLVLGVSGLDLVVAFALAAGAVTAAWAAAKRRARTVGLALGAAGLVQSYWTVTGANVAFAGYFVGNVLFTVGAALVAAGLWADDASPGRA